MRLRAVERTADLRVEQAQAEAREARERHAAERKKRCEVLPALAYSVADPEVRERILLANHEIAAAGAGVRGAR